MIQPSEYAPVVYLIFSHRDPAQVNRLVWVLHRESPGAQIVIRHDERRSRLDPSALPPTARIHLARDGFQVDWGTFSLVEAVLEALRFIERNIRFSWVTLLSGQDYPLRPIEDIEGGLRSSDADALLGDVWLLPARYDAVPLELRDFYLRYFYAHYPLPRPLARATVLDPLDRTLRRSAEPPPAYVRRLAAGTPWRIGIRRRGSPFGAGLDCYVSSDWFSASRTGVRSLLRFCDEHREALDFFRTTIVPSEAVFATALMNDGGIRVHRDNRRYVAWDQPTSHPRTVERSDLAAMTSSGKDFARKFDATVDGALLDAIDARRRGGGR